MIKVLANRRRGAKRAAKEAEWNQRFDEIWDAYDQVFRHCGGETWLRHNLMFLNPHIYD